MRKPNYRHVKRQKEEAKKTRRLEKDQRRTDRSGPTDDATADPVSLNGESVDPAPAGETTG